MHALAVGGQLQARGGAEAAWAVPIRRPSLPIQRAEVVEGPAETPSSQTSDKCTEELTPRFSIRDSGSSPHPFVLLNPFETRKSPFPPPRGPLIPESARGFQLGGGPTVMVVPVFHGVNHGREVDEEEEIDREQSRALRKRRGEKSKSRMCVPRACHPRPSRRATLVRDERRTRLVEPRISPPLAALRRTRERGTRHAYATPIP